MLRKMLSMSLFSFFLNFKNRRLCLWQVCRQGCWQRSGGDQGEKYGHQFLHLVSPILKNFTADWNYFVPVPSCENIILINFFGRDAFVRLTIRSIEILLVAGIIPASSGTFIPARRARSTKR